MDSIDERARSVQRPKWRRARGQSFPLPVSRAAISSQVTRWWFRALSTTAIVSFSGPHLSSLASRRSGGTRCRDSGAPQHGPGQQALGRDEQVAAHDQARLAVHHHPLRLHPAPVGRHRDMGDADGKDIGKAVVGQSARAGQQTPETARGDDGGVGVGKMDDVPPAAENPLREKPAQDATSSAVQVERGPVERAGGQDQADDPVLLQPRCDAHAATVAGGGGEYQCSDRGLWITRAITSLGTPGFGALGGSFGPKHRARAAVPA